MTRTPTPHSEFGPEASSLVGDIYSAESATPPDVGADAQVIEMSRPLANGSRLTLRDFHGLPNAAKAEIREKKAHIDEIRYGTPVDPDTARRPEYSPAIPLTTKCRSKELELRRKAGERNGKYDGYSARRLEDLVREVEKYGVLALVSARMFRRPKPFGQSSDAVVRALTEIHVSWRGDATPDFQKVLYELRRRVADGSLSGPVPGERTLRKLWGTITRDENPLTKTPRAIESARLSPAGRQQRSRDALAPGTHCQIDTYRCDLKVLDTFGHPIVAQLTVMIDVCTLSVIGTSVVADAPKAEDHSYLLVRSVIPPNRRRENTDWLDYKLPQMQWAEDIKELNLSSVLRHENARPYIRATQLIHDRGADYMSVNFRETAELLGITITAAGTRSPTDKAYIEALFDMVRRRLVQHLPGYTGGAPERRGVRVWRDDELLTIEELAELFDRWVTVVYQNTPRSLPGGPAGRKKLSPNKRYEAFYATTGLPAVPVIPEQNSLRPKVQDGRKVHRDGVQYANRKYDSPQLNLLRGMNVEVRYEPFNPSVVYVKDPNTQAWITCTCTSDERYRFPFAGRLATETKRVANDLGVDVDNDLAQMELIGQTLARTPARQAAAAKAQRRTETSLALRQQQEQEIAFTTSDTDGTAIVAARKPASDRETNDGPTRADRTAIRPDPDGGSQHLAAAAPIETEPLPIRRRPVKSSQMVRNGAG